MFLAREDIHLWDLRRSVFRSSSKAGLLHAAVSNTNFAIFDSDISEVFADPANAKDRAIALTQSAKGATLVQKQTLRWFIKQHDLDKGWVLHRSEEHLRARFDKLTGKPLEDEVLQMRLFEYARGLTIASQEGAEAVRDWYRGDLEYLQKWLKDKSKFVVAGNPWETYLHLREAIRDLRALRHLLPVPNDEWLVDTKKLSPDFV